MAGLVVRVRGAAPPLLYHVAGGVPSKGMWRAARTAKMTAVAEGAWGRDAVAAAHKEATAATDRFYLERSIAEQRAGGRKWKETRWRWDFGMKHALEAPENNFTDFIHFTRS